MDGVSWVQNRSLTAHRSESKKRGILELEEAFDSSQKRVKIRDLGWVLQSGAQAERGGSYSSHSDVLYSDSTALDLDGGSVNKTTGEDCRASINECSDLPPVEDKMQHDDGIKKAKGLDLDLNIEDISSSVNDPFYPYKNYQQSMLRDEFECGSSADALDGKDSMRIWKGLKKNNYMSAPCGAVPATIPKPRGRKKSSNDVMKRKMELAKKEQVDRFARVAAPSGLLNGLNPGIINHVRNSKQVHSIIEALVRSEKSENKRSGNNDCNQIKGDAQALVQSNEQEKAHSLGFNASGFHHGDLIIGRQQISGYKFFSRSVYADEVIKGNADLNEEHDRTFSRISSQCNKGSEDDKVSVKLPSSLVVGSENTGCSSDESANLGSVTTLSVKAANIASQWMELLSQDIRGRLAALRRSKKRVKAVITTELPLLISREFSSYSEKDSCTTTGSKVCHFDQANADTHSDRWRTLFAQMDKALCEEESYLESWLNQVKEMQSHCEKGLHQNSLYHSFPHAGPNKSHSRSRAADASENDLAIRAAAASIYSTCNFLLSTENLPCC